MSSAHFYLQFSRLFFRTSLITADVQHTSAKRLGFKLIRSLANCVFANHQINHWPLSSMCSRFSTDHCCLDRRHSSWAVVAVSPPRPHPPRFPVCFPEQTRRKTTITRTQMALLMLSALKPAFLDSKTRLDCPVSV